MKINRQLYLVQDIERADGSTIYVHSAPISREVYEAHFMLIAKAWATNYSENLGFLAGPRVSYMTIKRVAMEMGAWDGPSGVENTFFNEIRRLTSVIIPVEGKGYQTFPWHTALLQGLIDPDDAFQAENAISFFILACAMHNRTEIATILAGVTAFLSSAKTTYLTAMEFLSSLPTLTKEETSGEKSPLQGSLLPS